MPANFLLGKNCKSYWGSTAIDGSTHTVTSVLPDMTEASNIKDLTVNLEKTLADITVRGDGGWTTEAPTLKTATVTFQTRYKPGDTFFDALLDSYLNDTEFPFVALDQARSVDGAQGFASNFNVGKFDESQPLNEAVMVDVELKPSSYPQWYTVELSS